MRIVYAARSVIPSTTANSIQVMQMCQAMQRSGREVTLVARAGVLDVDVWDYYGIPTPFELIGTSRRGRIGGLHHSITALRAALRRPRAAVLYGRDVRAVELATAVGFPSIVELHDVPRDGRARKLVARVLRRPSLRRVVLISNGLREQLEVAIGVDLGDRAVVAPDGVHLDQFVDHPSPPTARADLDLPAPLVGYVGSLYRGRGVELIVQVAKRMPDVTFLVVGGQPEEVRAWQAHLAYDDVANVLMYGRVPHPRVPLFLAACDVLLMPYQRSVEVSGGGDTVAVMSPLKMFEYMASGRPMVASDLPVLREVLSEENAVLVPSDDPAAWTSAVSKLLRNHELRRALGQSARAQVPRYGWDQRVRTCLDGI